MSNTWNGSTDANGNRTPTVQDLSQYFESHADSVSGSWFHYPDGHWGEIVQVGDLPYKYIGKTPRLITFKIRYDPNQVHPSGIEKSYTEEAPGEAVAIDLMRGVRVRISND